MNELNRESEILSLEMRGLTEKLTNISNERQYIDTQLTNFNKSVNDNLKN